MSVKLECIGCRETKDFPDFEEYPVCATCREWEKKHLEEINSPEYLRGSILENKANAKKPIPNTLRWAVWERDNFTCKHCGARQNLSVDHIIPESKGGELTMENTQTLCKSCNSRKGAR